MSAVSRKAREGVIEEGVPRLKQEGKCDVTGHKSWRKAFKQKEQDGQSGGVETTGLFWELS